MSINIPTHFVSQFSTAVELLLQQKGSKLRANIRTGMHRGKGASPVNQFGAIEAQAPAGRFAPLVRTDAPVSRRWVYPSDFEIAQLIDEFDMLKIIEDPKGAYAENAAYAMARKMDDLIIAAALATSAIGETGSGTEAFDTTNFSVAADYGAAGEVGLTWKKLAHARAILREASVDLENETLTLVIGPEQEENLLNEATVISSDFNPKPTVVEGKVTRFAGFDIVVSNRLALVNTDDRACFVFAKSGMYLGIWQDMQNTVSRRDDLSSLPWQLHTAASFGATRLEQGKVVRILCDEV